MTSDPSDTAAGATAADGAGADTAEGPGADLREPMREALTMALYVSLSLLAVLLAMPVAAQDNRVQAGLIVLARAYVCGLVVVVAAVLLVKLVAGH